MTSPITKEIKTILDPAINAIFRYIEWSIVMGSIIAVIVISHPSFLEKNALMTLAILPLWLRVGLDAIVLREWFEENLHIRALRSIASVLTPIVMAGGVLFITNYIASAISEVTLGLH